MISLIHPSRGRPEKSNDTVNDWIDMAGTDDIEFILSVDNSDEYKGAYCKEYYLFQPRCEWTYIEQDNKSVVDAINRAAKIAKGDLLIVISDDTECFKDWGLAILKIVEGKTDWILKTQDGLQPYIITLPIMDRAYYNRFGYIYHPDYLHCFCDTELTCVADITGRKLTSNLLFPHKHYSVIKEPPDATNKRADATWDQGEKLFLERYKRNFDLPKGNPIQGIEMIRWLERKAR